MNDLQTPAPSEAGDADVSEAQETVVQSEVEVASEEVAPEGAASGDEGQVKPPPAEDAKASEDEKAKSDSKARAERRKAARNKAREELEAANRRAKEAEAELQAYKTPSKVPVESDFQSFEQYQAALNAHYVSEGIGKRDQSKAEREAQAAKAAVEAAQKAEQAEIERNWNEQAQVARAQYSDFDQVISNPNLMVSEAVAQAIKSSDIATEVAYFVGKNPAEAQRLSSLSGPEMARALGRIEGQLAASAPKTVSTAPPPVSPVTASSVADFDPSKASFDEFRKAWDEGRI